MENTKNQRQILANEPEDVSEAQEDQPNYMDTLPDELHLEILKKLPQLELDSLGFVCRRFNSIIQDRRLWKKEVVGHGRVDLSYIIKFITRRPLQNLFLHHVEANVPLGDKLPTSSEATLKKVSLWSVSTYPDNLARMLSKCRQLRKVCLADISVNDDVFVALSKNINIEHLCLAHVTGITPFGLEIFLRNVRKLQEFYISCNSDTMTIEFICKNLAPSILHLTLLFRNNLLTDGHVAHVVRNCPLLERLSLGPRHRLTAKSTDSLQNLKHLRILYMPNCTQIRPADFLDMVTEMENLVELNIRNERNRERREEIERLFAVTMMKHDGFSRVATFKTRFRVVRITY